MYKKLIIILFILFCIILMSINQIIFEHIDNKYAYGKYSDFTVIIMKENRYINASKLCSVHGKKLDKWTRNDNSKELIKMVDDKLGDKKSIIQITSKEYKGILRGTYVHELLMESIINYIGKPKNDKPELNVVCNLNKELGGKCEVQTPYGRIDVLTEEQIIEVKEAKNWKHALGQILVYSTLYPKKQRRIHLFNITNQDLKEIEKIYKQYNVKLSYE